MPGNVPKPPVEMLGGVLGPTITPFEDSMDGAVEAPPPPTPDARNSAVFLKQNGQIYMVSDWETLKRWIAESRVDRHDLVSEGGVRWEPIGSRPDLLPSFAGADIDTPSEAQTVPFGGETPFGGGDYKTASGWHDDDTEGIPTGLPPLPTDEIPHAGSTGFDAVDLKPRHLTPTPPPVARRQPPPVQRPMFVPPPPPEVEAPPEPVMDPIPEEPVIAPPALPDTAPPPPERVRERMGLTDDLPTLDPTPVRPDPIDSEEFEAFYEENTEELVLKQQSRRGTFAFLGCAGLLVFCVCALGAIYAFNPGRNGRTDVTPTLPNPPPALPDPVQPAPVAPVPAPEPDPEPEPVPEPPPVPVPTPAPEPPPVPGPTPAPGPVSPTPSPAPGPAPAPRVNVNALIDQGWNLADGSPSRAAEKFKAALDASPNNVDAQYGYGYALLNSGKPQAALTYLCRAAARGNKGTKAEIRGMLNENGLSCE